MMNKLVFGWVALGCTSAFADCSVSVSQWGVNGEHLSDRYVIQELNDALAEKGYSVTADTHSKYNMHLHYYGMISESGRSKTVGTVLTFSAAEDKKEIASARSERFFGRERSISKFTLNQNIRKIISEIPSCN